jgi:DNA (cytosine-5)-methyltransferase 1
MREIIIDNFAGGGGATEGLEEALRLLYEHGLVDEELHVDYAVNHDAWACAMHKVNHPRTTHLRNNVWGVDPDSIIGPIGLGWFSPDCKDFSKAKGGKPVEKNIRDLAWVVVRWARRKQGGPRIFMLENVEEFRHWGPLGEDGKRCPLQKGKTFKRWVAELRRRGYKKIEWRELRGCDYGDPTIRKRLFVIGRRDGQPIIWPRQTHGNPKKIAAAKARVAAGDADFDTIYMANLPPWKTAASLIDWALPCPSIFMTKEEAVQYKEETGTRVVRPLQPKTMSRIAAGLDRYVINCESPYIVNIGGNPYRITDIEVDRGEERAGPFISNLTHHGGDRNESIEDPFATITGAHRGEKALVVPYVSAAQQGGSNRAIDDPLHTITASVKDQNQLIVPTLIQSGYGEREGQRPRVLDLAEPLGTVVADGVKHALVTPVIKAWPGVVPEGEPTEVDGSAWDRLPPAPTATAPFITGVGGRMGQTDPRGVDQPMQTLTAKADSVVITPVLQSYYGQGAGGDNRSNSLEEPLRTQTTENRHAIIVPSLVRTAHGDVDKSGKKRGRGDHSLEDPFSTVTGLPDHALVAPHLTKFRSDSVGSSMDEPVPTVTANSFVKRAGGAAPLGVVAAHVQRHYGESVGHPIDEPSGTITAGGGGKSALLAAHLMTMRNAGKPFNGADEPTHTVTSGGARLHLVAAFMAQHNLGVVGHEVEEPVSTILQKGAQQNLVAANLTRQFGTGVPSALDEPTKTIMPEGYGKVALTAAFLQSYFGSLQDPKIVDPMHTVTTKDRFGLCVVSIYGEQYIITDIGMRMLSPRELFRAQGFRDSYIIEWGIAVADDEELGWKEGQRVAITKTQQVSKCGNSVNPGIACALAFANYCPMDINDEEQPEFMLQAAE